MSGSTSTASSDASGDAPTGPELVADTPHSPATPAVTADDALGAAKPPVGSGPTPLLGQVAALLLIAVGVVGVQEALSRMGIVKSSWTSWVLKHLAGRSATFSMLVLFVVLALIGLTLLWFAFKPRPRKALTLKANTGVYLRGADLARIVQSRVDGADGVSDVNASSSRKKLVVGISTVQRPTEDAAVEADVKSRLQPVLDALSTAPRLAVEISHQDLS